ncbi:hypothetical protein, partial [Actinoplanes sp. RD1]|uniref:hypothetical protein n=1 Tax=Actinoplanes sp. RD1 TaxID=3064538 RepID=UPI00274128AA
GVTWRDVPAAEVFPEIPPGASGFLQLSGATWLRRVDAWATANGFGAALPTGWAAAPGGGWVVGVVLFEAAAVQRVPVSGEALGYHQELCAREANWSEPDAPETGSVTAIASADGIASPAPLAINEAPFGDPLFAEPGKVAYLRCVARRNGSAVIAVLAQGPDAVRLVMRPRQDSRRVVFFANSASKGAWIVAHRFNFSTNAGMGEVASFYRREGAGVAQAFDITTGTAGAGRVQAHTVGFVKQGLFGVALPIMSFSWSTFLGLSAGMDLTFTWVSP